MAPYRKVSSEYNVGKKYLTYRDNRIFHVSVRRHQNFIPTRRDSHI